jgi:hypothetical protein
MTVNLDSVPWINSIRHCSNYRTLEFQMPVYCPGQSGLKFRSSSTSNRSQAMSTEELYEDPVLRE